MEYGLGLISKCRGFESRGLKWPDSPKQGTANVKMKYSVYICMRIKILLVCLFYQPFGKSHFMRLELQQTKVLNLNSDMKSQLGEITSKYLYVEIMKCKVTITRYCKTCLFTFWQKVCGMTGMWEMPLW